MEEIVTFIYLLLVNSAILTLTALGLVIIFGVMGVINMAHGEFMMVGALGAVLASSAGLPISVAVLTGAVTSTIMGVVLERLIIRRFYKQLLVSLIVTWGVSLVIIQVVLLIFGPSVSTLPIVFPSIKILGRSFSSYNVLLIGCSLLFLLILAMLLKITRLGLYARATIDDADVSESLGINTSLIYGVTFALGSFFAGLTGAIFAFQQPVTPTTFGSLYTAIAFIVVVVAGSKNVFIGLPLAVIVLAIIKTVVTLESTLLLGDIGMLVAALIIIRYSPTGIYDLVRSMRLSWFGFHR